MKEYGYEYDATLDQYLWEQTRGCVTQSQLWGGICLRSGRDALKTVAREFEPTVVLMPALSCDSMALPFQMYGHQIHYYRLDKSYSIDLQFLEGLMHNNTKPILFLYMDYFGNLPIKDDELTELKMRHHNLIFIEDRTHSLVWERTNQFEPDYIVASLRKWINIPDGGLLWTKNLITHTDFTEDTSFCELRLRAQCMRNKYFLTGDESLKLEYRSIFSQVAGIMDRDKEPSRMSSYAYEIARKTDWNKLRKHRKKNSGELIKILKEASVELIQKEEGVSDLYVAFMVHDREYRQKKLSSKGIFNTIIWPLNEKQRSVCPVARFTEKHMLAAPCDQRYCVDDMKYIGNEIVRVINE